MKATRKCEITRPTVSFRGERSAVWDKRFLSKIMGIFHLNLVQKCLKISPNYLVFLHVSNHGCREKVVESFFRLHLFSIKLSYFFHDFFCKNLETIHSAHWHWQVSNNLPWWQRGHFWQRSRRQGWPGLWRIGLQCQSFFLDLRHSIRLVRRS